MTKVVIIGAGSAVFARNMIGDLLLFDDIKIDNISLVDINERKLRVMEKIAKKMVKQTGKDTVIEASTNRRDVLKDATYVINTIAVGGVDIYKRDLEIADSYGVIQALGDIINPAGIFRMLRAYPEIVGMTKDMEELCPNAYFFNYTNPMAPICLALFKDTSIKTFGFCHSVQGTAAELAGYLDAEPEDMSYWAAGINHMAWYLTLKCKGEDAYPKLFEITDTLEKMHEVSKKEKMYNFIDKNFSDSVRMTIMRNFGYYVSESPYHMSEYTPYFRKNMDTIKKYKVDYRWWLAHEMANDDYFDQLESIADDESATVEFKMSDEYAPKVIRANLTGEIFRANLNVMNTGLITNIPNDTCVEVPCYADREGIHPAYVGDLPDGCVGLNMTNVNEHKLMAKAANEKKLEWIYQAIQLDPLTSAILDLDQIREMTGKLIENNKEYLKDFT